MRCERGRTLDIEPRWWGCARIGGSHQRLSPPVERVCRILTLPASPDEGLERQPVCSHRMHRNRDNKVRTNKASRLTADTTQKLRHTTKHVQTKWRPFCKSRVMIPASSFFDLFSSLNLGQPNTRQGASGDLPQTHVMDPSFVIFPSPVFPLLESGSGAFLHHSAFLHALSQLIMHNAPNARKYTVLMQPGSWN